MIFLKNYTAKPSDDAFLDDDDIVYLRSVNDPYTSDDIGGLVYGFNEMRKMDHNEYDHISEYINSQQQNADFILQHGHNSYAFVISNGLFHPKGRVGAPSIVNGHQPDSYFSKSISYRKDDIYLNGAILRGEYNGDYINDKAPAFIESFINAKVGHRKNMHHVRWHQYTTDQSLKHWANSIIQYDDHQHHDLIDTFCHDVDGMIRHMDHVYQSIKDIIPDQSPVGDLIDHAKTVRESYISTVKDTSTIVDASPFIDLITEDMEQIDYTLINIRRSGLYESQQAIIQGMHTINDAIISVKELTQ
jgi:hypothetical protein